MCLKHFYMLPKFISYDNLSNYAEILTAAYVFVNIFQGELRNVYTMDKLFPCILEIFSEYLRKITGRSRTNTRRKQIYTIVYTLFKNVSSSFRVRSSLTSCIFHVTEDDIQLTLNYNLT